MKKPDLQKRDLFTASKYYRTSFVYWKIEEKSGSTHAM